MNSVSVHPFAAVTVTVYVPPSVMEAEAAFPSPLSHSYVPPPVAVTEIAVVVQLITEEPVVFIIPAVGKVFTVIVLVIEVVPQLPPLVVNVNVIDPLSEPLAVYVAVDGFVAFVHVPAPPDHVPPVADPPTEPPMADEVDP